MVFTHGESIILCAFALIGLWTVWRDVRCLWQSWTAPCQDFSFIVLVKDAEDVIEDILRQLLNELEQLDSEADIVLVDCGSEDMTYPIAVRISKRTPRLTVLKQQSINHDFDEAVLNCRGKIIHIFDTVDRLELSEVLKHIHYLLHCSNSVH